jgi:hypothetical protein
MIRSHTLFAIHASIFYFRPFIISDVLTQLYVYISQLRLLCRLFQKIYGQPFVSTA